MKTFIRLFVFFVTTSLLVQCGSSATLTISGEESININDCVEYTVTRSEAVSSDTIVQPGMDSGTNGGVYSDSSCTTVAVFDIVMSAGSAVTHFYFKSTAAGSYTLSAGTLPSMSETDTIDVTSN